MGSFSLHGEHDYQKGLYSSLPRLPALSSRQKIYMGADLELLEYRACL